MKRQISIAIALTIILTFSACTKKAATPGAQADPFSPAVRAADDIALSIKLLTETERNLEMQKIITPQEGLRVIDGLSALHEADVKFVADITAARKAGDRTALAPSLAALRQAVVSLNSKGVLGIKSNDARLAFQTAMNSLDLAIAGIDAFTR